MARRACFLAAGVLAAGAPAANGQATPPAAGMEAQDSTLVRAGAVVVSSAEKIDRVWPGHWPAGRPFLLAIPGVAVLLHTKAPAPPGFHRVPQQPNAAEAGTTYLLRGDLPGLHASRGLMDITFPVGGDSAVAVPLGDNLSATLRFLFHEGFHGYQTRAFVRPHAMEVTSGGEALLTPEYGALAHVEARLLAEALAGPDDAEIRRLVRGYLAVRDRRTATIPEDLRRYERELERIEGSAEWVGRLAAAAALDRSPEEISRSLIEELDQPLRVPRFASGPHWLIRLRVYRTGAASAVLLQRLLPGWRTRLERGETFPDLLAAAAGYDAVVHAAEANAALSRHGEAFAEPRP